MSALPRPRQSHMEVQKEEYQLCRKEGFIEWYPKREGKSSPLKIDQNSNAFKFPMFA